MTGTKHLRHPLGLLLALTLGAFSVTADELKGVHEVMDPNAIEDDLGISVPIPISHPARRYPATDSFPSGPDVGERLPEIRLTNQLGEMIDFHARQRAGNAVVMFFRSVVW